MNQEADISVIIPAYNRATIISETLFSLLIQTFPAKEIIVVDDGSQDGTAETVLEILKLGEAEKLKISKGKPWPEFKVIRQKNAGPGAARNRGFAESTGEFIHFFDSDDIAAPNKHEVQLKALLETGADIAYGAWVKGRFAPPMADSGSLRTEGGLEEKAEKLKSETLKNVSAEESKLADSPVSESLTRSASIPASSPATRHQLPTTIYSGFTPEGPVLQAKGLPKGNLVRALLTNWSVVPHACLFRRSILEKAGGFPEDIWVGEDQLLFLRCLLAGARCVHTPGTMVFYRVGDDPGKLTATGAAQKRHARDWGRFLLKANQEVTSGQCRVARVEEKNSTTIERQGGREKEQPKVGPKGEGVGTTESKSTEGAQGNAQGTCAGAAFSNPFTSELARDSENTSLTRFASAPASAPATSHSLLATAPEAPEAPSPATSYSLLATAPEALTTPSAWFGFRLRAYEAWRDLEKFFPNGEDELKNELQGIWKLSAFSGFRFQFSGFVLRKLGGLKLRIMGYREHASFRCGQPSEVGFPPHEGQRR